MAVYTLLANVNAIGSLPPPLIVRPINNAEKQSLFVQGAGNLLDPNLPITPPTQEAFQVEVSGVGTVGGSVQIYGSNDGQSWLSIGALITAAPAAGKSSSGGFLNSSFAFYGAVCTAISGTGAKLSCTMSC